VTCLSFASFNAPHNPMRLVWKQNS